MVALGSVAAEQVSACRGSPARLREANKRCAYLQALGYWHFFAFLAGTDWRLTTWNEVTTVAPMELSSLSLRVAMVLVHNQPDNLGNGAPASPLLF